MLKFFAEKMCSAKATHIFSAKNIRILCIESTKTVNEMTLNELVKLTTNQIIHKVTDLTLVLLNKLRCHTFFKFSAHQIT